MEGEPVLNETVIQLVARLFVQAFFHPGATRVPIKYTVRAAAYDSLRPYHVQTKQGKMVNLFHWRAKYQRWHENLVGRPLSVVTSCRRTMYLKWASSNFISQCNMNRMSTVRSHTSHLLYAKCAAQIENNPREKKSRAAKVEVRMAKRRVVTVYNNWDSPGHTNEVRACTCCCNTGVATQGWRTPPQSTWSHNPLHGLVYD